MPGASGSDLLQGGDARAALPALHVRGSLQRCALCVLLAQRLCVLCCLQAQGMLSTAHQCDSSTLWMEHAACSAGRAVNVLGK